MNTMIFELTRRLLMLASILILSFSDNSTNNFLKVNVLNVDNGKLSKVQSMVDPFDTIESYNYKIPIGEKRILKKGSDGLYVKHNNEIIMLKEKISEEIEVGLGKYGTYEGLLTGYGPDCKTCDGRGIVFCPTKNNTWFNIIDNGVYYNDDEYGSVRIVAADQREFPCGTIVTVTNTSYKEPILAIVLDTGSAMKKSYNNGLIHFDLAFKNESEALNTTNKKTTFQVKRWGW